MAGSKTKYNNSVIAKSICVLMMATSMSACSVVQAFREYQAGTTNKYAMDEGGNYEDPSYYTWGSSGNMRAGHDEANQAIVYFVKGDLQNAERYVQASLAKNPKEPYALLIAAIICEQQGRPNRARQYYEDLVLMNASAPSMFSSMKLATTQPVYSTAQERLKMLELKQSALVISDEKTGEKRFNVMEQTNPLAMMPTAPTSNISNYSVAQPMMSDSTPQQSDITSAISSIFNQGEKYTISRFITFKKLAEAGLITKEEFYTRRKANIGALLPQTSQPPAEGLDRPVPSPEMVLERLSALKKAFEMRSITAREHASERNLIIDALLPAKPVKRAEPPPPPEGLLDGAEDVRKLEVLLKDGLITDEELSKEKSVIEKLVRMSTVDNEPTPTQKKTLPQRLI